MKYTKEQILAMTAGKELDRKVAEFMDKNMEVFEFAWEAGNNNGSTDISAAWDVFQDMKGRLFSKRNVFMKHLQDLVSVGMEKELVIAYPDVFWHITPEIICKAALLTELE